jgi:hypothetical protein
MDMICEECGKSIGARGRDIPSVGTVCCDCHEKIEKEQRDEGTFERSILVHRCDCGTYVWCPEFTNTCYKCGADYNGSGQRLADRSQWGEETGEHWSECIGPFDGEEL